MKKSTFSPVFLLLVSLSFNYSSAQSLIQFSTNVEYGNSLIRIFTEGKVGYIDTTGKLIIPPKFANAFDFAEGLAPARVNGKFGFINTRGEFVVQPKYEYAEEFKSGTALVYRDSIARFLSINGTEKLFPNYQTIKFISDTKAYVVTRNGNTGFINHNGDILLDTIYSEAYFDENYLGTVFKKVTENISGDYSYELAVIDTNLNFVVPFGKYTTVSQPRRGFIYVTFSSDSEDVRYYGILNKHGKLIMRQNADEKEREYNITQAVNDSIFVVVFNEHNDSGNFNPQRYYGILNTKSNIIIKNENWTEVYALSDNFFSVYNKSAGKNFFINNKSEIMLDTNLYDYFKFDRYPDKDYFFLYKESFTALYDKSGNVVIPFQDKAIYSVEELSNKPNPKYIYFFDEGKNTVKIIKDDWSPGEKSFSGYFRFICNKNGTISAFDSNYYYVLNKNYKQIYKGKLYGRKSFINVDYMKQQNYRPEKQAKKIKLNLNFEKNRIPENNISLFINDKERKLFGNHFEGLNMYIINMKDKIVDIANIDFINIKLQAKDKEGEWKYIEGQFISFFDFAWGRIKVAKNGGYLYTVPVFKGDFETELRAELQIANPDNERETMKIYSNVIDCKINESQFWRKMDNGFRYDYANPYLSIINGP